MAALERAPNALDRDDWVRLCLALKGAHADNAVRSAFIDFSARWTGDVDPNAAAHLWDTAEPDGSLSLGTVFQLLDDNGFATPQMAPPRLPASFGTRNTEYSLFGRDGYRLLNAAAFIDGFEAPDYILDGILRRGWLYTFTAPTGSGKTAVTMLCAEAIGLGEPIFDNEVSQGAVLYLAGENPDDVRARFIASLDERGIDPEKVPIFFVDGVISIRAHLGQIETDFRNAEIELTLVVVDTLAAYFEGDDLNNNAQQQEYATSVLRGLTKLPGRPTVIVATHPVKNASRSNLVPMGGSALLNQVDGNLTAWRSDQTIDVHWQGKFRGAPFEPMQFELVACTSDRLKDSKGRHMPTVHARPLTMQRGMTLVNETEQRENRLLELIHGNPRISERALAQELKCSRSTANRIKCRLFDRKWIKTEGRDLALTADGKKVIGK